MKYRILLQEREWKVWYQTMRIILWLKKKQQQKKFIGNTAKLVYEIAVNPIFQGVIHTIASCALGAFVFISAEINWLFLLLFVVIYGSFILLFILCNENRATRNSLLEVYETAFSSIKRALQEESKQTIQLCSDLKGTSLKEAAQMIGSHNIFTEACFRVCAALEKHFTDSCGKNLFRVIVFLRTTSPKDLYSIVGFSPIEPAPEAYGQSFKLGKVEPSGLGKPPKPPVHALPFMNSRHDPIILIGNDVKDSYTDFNESHPTKLHISIPCNISGTVRFALQITSYQADILGDRNRITEIVNHVISVYLAYLKTVYLQQRCYEISIEKEICD